MSCTNVSTQVGPVANLASSATTTATCTTGTLTGGGISLQAANVTNCQGNAINPDNVFQYAAPNGSNGFAGRITNRSGSNVCATFTAVCCSLSP